MSPGCGTSALEANSLRCFDFDLQAYMNAFQGVCLGDTG